MGKLPAGFGHFLTHEIYANSSLEHGRIEIRKILTTSALNGYLDLPHLRQAFAIDRETI